MKKGYLTYWSW